MQNQRIVISEKILFGKPRIKGTRISVEQILACLADGWSHKKIAAEFGVSVKDVKAALEFAYKSVSRTHFIDITAGKKIYV